MTHTEFELAMYAETLRTLKDLNLRFRLMKGFTLGLELPALAAILDGPLQAMALAVTQTEALGKPAVEGVAS